MYKNNIVEFVLQILVISFYLHNTHINKTINFLSPFFYSGIGNCEGIAVVLQPPQSHPLFIKHFLLTNKTIRLKIYWIVPIPGNTKRQLPECMARGIHYLRNDKIQFFGGKDLSGRHNPSLPSCLVLHNKYVT